MPDNRDDNCFVYRAEYSGLIIELTSDETSLFKLDFVKENEHLHFLMIISAAEKAGSIPVFTGPEIQCLKKIPANSI
jgi:hypothetical protein